MNRARAVLFALLTAAWLVTGATLAAAVAPNPASVSQEETTTEAQDDNEIGSKISSFMQANAAQTSGAVENEMWVASYNASDRTVREGVVERRTRGLQGQLDELEQEQRSLIEAREQNEISELQYEARMSAVVGAYISISKAIESVESRAEESGADVSQVEALRERARNLTGPEVAVVARNMNGTGDVPGLGGERSATDTRGVGNGNANASNANGTNGNGGENGLGAGNATDAVDGSVAGNGSTDVPGVGNGTNVTGPVLDNGTNATEPVLDDGTNISGPVLGDDTSRSSPTEATQVTSATTTEAFDADAPGSNASGTRTDSSATETTTGTAATAATGNASTLPFNPQ